MNAGWMPSHRLDPSQLLAVTGTQAESSLTSTQRSAREEALRDFIRQEVALNAALGARLDETTKLLLDARALHAKALDEATLPFRNAVEEARRELTKRTDTYEKLVATIRASAEEDRKDDQREIARLRARLSQEIERNDARKPRRRRAR